MRGIECAYVRISGKSLLYERAAEKQIGHESHCSWSHIYSTALTLFVRVV